MSYSANEQYQHCVAPFDASQGDEEETRVSIVFRHIKNVLDHYEIEENVERYHEEKKKRDEKKLV